MTSVNTKKLKIGRVCMCIGIVLILGALALIVNNRLDDRRARNESAEVMTLLQEQMVESSDLMSTGLRAKMSSAQVDGYSYIGVLTIPSLDISLPIMSTWSYPLLKVAPCRYQGTAAKGDLIIAGHNYTSHFGNLKYLTLGDKVVFQDIDGNVLNYTVTGSEIVDKYDPETMKAGEWDMTLFTCTIGGSQRVTIRCTLTDNGM